MSDRPRQRKHASATGARLPFQGARMQRIKDLMKEAGGSGAWGMRVMRGCTCIDEESEPCEVCIAVAKTGKIKQPAPTPKQPTIAEQLGPELELGSRIYVDGRNYEVIGLCRWGDEFIYTFKRVRDGIV